MTELTKVTNTVIQSNTVMGYNIQSEQIENRHYVDASISIDKLDETANVSAVQENVNSATDEFRANDFATWESAKANDYSTLLAAQSNDLATYNQLVADLVDVSGDIMTGTLEIVRNHGDILLKLRETTGSNGFIFTSDTGESYIIPIRDNAIHTANALLYSTNNVRWEFGTTPYVTGSSRIWHENNDGSGSGLNADLLDGVEYTTIDANVYNTLLSAYANDLITYNEANANDYSSWQVITSNVNTVQSNLTSLISGSTEFTAPTKIFQGDVIVQGNVTIQGDTFTANVENVVSEDTTIIVNWGGSDATAEGAGLGIAGTSNDLLANIVYASGSTSLFRVGAGPLTSADDIARRQDYQANDSSTWDSARANDFATWETAKANDHSTLISAYANDIVTWESAKANDYSTLLTAYANDLATYDQAVLTARANDHSTLLSAYANDLTTYDQAVLTARANDYSTLLSAYANDHITWVSINANLDSIQDNVDSISTTVNAIPWTNSNVSTSSNVYFVGAPGTVEGENSLYVSFGGVVQPETEWIFNGGNNTIQFTDASVPVGENVIIQAFYRT